MTIDAKVFVLDAFCNTAAMVKSRVLKAPRTLCMPSLSCTSFSCWNQALREAVASACVLPSRLVFEATTGTWLSWGACSKECKGICASNFARDGSRRSGSFPPVPSSPSRRVAGGHQRDCLSPTGWAYACANSEYEVQPPVEKKSQSREAQETMASKEQFHLEDLKSHVHSGRMPVTGALGTLGLQIHLCAVSCPMRRLCRHQP